jgi:hypothetical protein
MWSAHLHDSGEQAGGGVAADLAGAPTGDPERAVLVEAHPVRDRVGDPQQLPTGTGRPGPRVVGADPDDSRHAVDAVEQAAVAAPRQPVGQRQVVVEDGDRAVALDPDQDLAPDAAVERQAADEKRAGRIAGPVVEPSAGAGRQDGRAGQRLAGRVDHDERVLAGDEQIAGTGADDRADGAVDRA